MKPQDDPTPEEVEEELLADAAEEDDRQRKANIEAARKKNWEFEAGVGWKDQDGTLRLDDLGREL